MPGRSLSVFDNDNKRGDSSMKKVVFIALAALVFTGTFAWADKATEQEVRQAIIDGNAYVRKNLKSQPEGYSKDGAIEFWSSGGFMQKIPANTRPEEYESFNINVKHIHVTILVPGQAAIAHYYSEGSMQPKGGAAISNYRTRVSQVFVKEGGTWKVRASHWSPMAGGAGTNQTALVE